MMQHDMVSITEFQRWMSKHKSILKGIHLAFTGPDVPVEMRAAGSSSRYNQSRNTILTIYGYSLLSLLHSKRLSTVPY